MGSIRPRGSLRLCVLVTTILLVTGGCRGDLRDPTGISGPADTGGIGTGTGGGGGGGSSSLIGSWQTTFVFDLGMDVQRHTVTWSFGSGGSCHKAVEIYSVLEDRTLTTETSCVFRVGSGDVTITFTGNTTGVTFRWSLVNFSRNTLLLDGVTYDRVG